MITAIDTNILLDILIPDKDHADASKGLLEIYNEKGRLTLVQADLLLTRDRGFYKTYFADLQIVQKP